MDEILLEIDDKMEKAFEALTHHFRKLRTGRASAAVLDDIRIDYYGQPTPIKQLCNVSIPEPRLIVVQPWDKTTLTSIEKGILAANLGITPDNDGKVIRLPFPTHRREAPRHREAGEEACRGCQGRRAQRAPRGKRDCQTDEERRRDYRG